MLKNLSATKRARTALRNRSKNKKYKIAIKKSIKKYLLDLHDNEKNTILADLSLVYKQIDKAVKKGVWHRNKANRKKSKLSKMITSTS
uniref:Small ribosomal subunit protein bS20c n=1 Tax=Caloglossa intermedia TaxID=100879 RepID=A0A1Z1M6S6_9FLOR|nr:ribosomal protein S20 [Caloglossa intermedia]ARW61454.1 ribosomal protein S20 [Caloglossa intermedia]